MNVPQTALCPLCSLPRANPAVEGKGLPAAWARGTVPWGSSCISSLSRNPKGFPSDHLGLRPAPPVASLTQAVSFRKASLRTALSLL